MKTSCSIFFVTLFVTCVVGGAFISGATGEVCTLRKDHGNGSFIYHRWYYDNDTMTCKQFWYRGSGGNGNRFVSRKNCSTTCKGRCYQPVPDSHNDILDDPECDGGGYEWYYYTERGVCLPFRTSSCHMMDTGNRFSTKHECKRDCIPNAPITQSSCMPTDKTRSAACTSSFILSGNVSSIHHHEIYSEHLVHRLEVVVDDVYKGRDLLNIHFVNQTAGDSSNTANHSHEIVSIRMIVSSGLDCHDVVKGSTYIFMGYVQHERAIIGHTSYVQPDTPGRRSKVTHSLPRCNARTHYKIIEAINIKHVVT